MTPGFYYKREVDEGDGDGSIGSRQHHPPRLHGPRGMRARKWEELREEGRGVEPWRQRSRRSRRAGARPWVSAVVPSRWVVDPVSAGGEKGTIREPQTLQTEAGEGAATGDGSAGKRRHSRRRIVGHAARARGSGRRCPTGRSGVCGVGGRDAPATSDCDRAIRQKCADMDARECTFCVPLCI